MKYIIGAVLAMCVFASFAIAGATRLPGGLAVATETQEVASGVTMGDGDVYIADQLTVGGTVTLPGAVTTTGATVLSTTTISNRIILVPTLLDVAVTSPTAVGQLGRTSAWKVYIASGTGNVAAWSALN